MDPIEFPESFDGVSVEDLTALREAAATELSVLFDPERTPSDDDVAEATRLDAGLDSIDAEINTRAEAEAARVAAMSALRDKFSAEDEPQAEEPEAEATEEVEVEVQEEVEVAATTQPKARAALAARRAPRPAKPSNTPSPVTITAAADVPDFSTGQDLNGMEEVAQALVARMRGFGTPSGDGSTENLQHYGVAKFKMDFPEDLTIKPHQDDNLVLNHAANEARLSGGSLTAAGGWCAPSETLYDLCVLESMDGILSLPEVNVSRGGIKYTKGPQWSDIYSSIGFTQTEAQAIAGTTKTCYEVTCPTFTDVRLDAVGVCIKAPILTNAAYPEVVQRIVSGSMVVHAHRVNAAVLTKMTTAAGSAFSAIDYGATTESTMASLALVAGIQRNKYKMALDESMEVVLPYWAKDVIREDLAQRGGRPLQAVTDEYITSEFAARSMSPQFVYDYNDLATDGSLAGWPTSFDVLMYPAGTFVKGTSDVITLNAVYDAASLATNVYTALFFEEGVLVANLCNEARRITVPTCASGKTGAQNAAVCAVDS